MRAIWTVALWFVIVGAMGACGGEEDASAEQAAAQLCDCFFAPEATDPERTECIVALTSELEQEMVDQACRNCIAHSSCQAINEGCEDECDEL